jgi:hypothetical protein
MDAPLPLDESENCSMLSRRRIDRIEQVAVWLIQFDVALAFGGFLLLGADHRVVLLFCVVGMMVAALALVVWTDGVVDLGRRLARDLLAMPADIRSWRKGAALVLAMVLIGWGVAVVGALSALLAGFAYGVGWAIGQM